ncbi:MAG TPA: 4-hydroxybenzoate transporter [Gammaproteobacteria bacterium]|nr:4-hydroxybenzoate transporter [Gammaproteobacteria bacterium]HCZ49217.1 4-hydroxybenzoate transporter [Gammaproteobacteria bacterium]MCH78655.1 4-hydroxybenzoate transporter [Gammaproteobacteria bacterium]
MGAGVLLPRWFDDARFGRYQVHVVLLCFIVTLFDGFDTQAIAFAGPALAQALGVGPRGLAPIVTAGVAGMALGAVVFGPIGDRYGRRVAVLLATAMFGLFSLLTALADSVGQLVVLRFLTGIGMGGAAPNVYTLASEFSPTRHRGVVMLLAGLGLPVGAILGGLIAGQVIPAWGWQGVFVIGGVAPLLALPVLMRVFPESPYFLARTGQHSRLRQLLARVAPEATSWRDVVFTLPEPPARVGAMALLAPDLRHNTLAIWATYFFNWVAWFGLVLWVPSVLSAAGLPEDRAGLATVTLNGAALVFMLPLAWWLPSLPVRRVILWLLVGAVGVSAILAVATGAGSVNWALVFAAVGLSGLLVGGPQIALNYLAVSIYPTAVRASGVGWAIGLGRVGTVLGGAAGGFVLADFGPQGFFWALMVPLALAGIAAVSVRDKRPVQAVGQ